VRRRAVRDDAAPVSTRPDALENAWRLHDVQMDWTSKVDAKAAFALTIQAALLAAAVVLLDDMNSPLEYTLMGGSVLAVAAGALLAARAVSPQLRTKHLARESHSSFIYFGHARAWAPGALADQLRCADMTDQVARQVVVMAEIAWTKHRRVAWSIWLAVAGGALLLAAGVVSRL
jgi:hypothetical protein